MLKLKKWTLLLAVNLSLAISVARGQGTITLVDTFGPGDAWDTGSGYAVENYDLGFGLMYTVVAMRISVPSGPDVSFTQLLAGMATGLGGGGVTISVTEDDGGQPGNVLENIHGTISGNGISTLNTFNSSLNPVLAAGNDYWLVATADSGNSHSWDLAYNDAAGPSLISHDGTAWDTDNLAVALRATAQVVVPEPGSGLLIGMGLLMVLFICRQRNRGRK